MRKNSLLFGVLRLPLDIILVIAAFIVAYELRRREIFPFDFLDIHLGGGILDPLSNYLFFAIKATFGFIILMALSGQYDLRVRFRPIRDLVRIITIISAWLMLIIASFFITHKLFFSRVVLAYTWILVIIFIFWGRLILSILEKLLTHFSQTQRQILFVGAGEISAQLAQQLRKDPRCRIVGALVTDNNERHNAKLKVIGTFSDLNKIGKRFQLDEIFQVASGLGKKELGELLAFCRENQIEFRFLPSILEIHSRNIDMETMTGLPIVYLKPSSLDGWGRVIKRIFDIIGSTTGLIILSPILLVTAIGVKINSPGPIIYRDYRVGKNKQPFIFSKFRSMRADMCSGSLSGTKDGDQLRQKLIQSENNIRRGTPMFKIKNDPRITSFGKFIRKTSLDELPNLFHVLTGKMSLVGPRPHLPSEIKNYKSYHNRVFAIKPGITGTSQISGRSDLDFDEEVRLDLAYIENWSLLLDLTILIKTVWAVLFYRHEE